MNNQTIKDDEEDYDPNEVRSIFLEACKRGKLKFIDFFIHNKELKHNVNLGQDGYDGLNLAIDNQHVEVVDYLLKFKEVTSDPDFDFDTIFRLTCIEDNSTMVKVFLDYADKSKIYNVSDYKEAFTCACRSGNIDNIKVFLSHKPIANIFSNEYLLEKFDEATRSANEKLVDFFLTDDSLNFRINSKYYFFKLSGFNPYYQRVKINKEILPLVSSYDLSNELPVSSTPKKRLKI